MPKSKRNRPVTLSKTKKKPGLERKGKVVTDIKDAVEHYANAYVFTYDNMRNQKLKDLREQLKSSSRIFLAGKKVMQIALGRSPADEAKTGLHKLSKFLQGDTGLFFTNLPRDDVERLFREFEEHDFARTGSIATETCSSTFSSSALRSSPSAGTAARTRAKLLLNCYFHTGCSAAFVTNKCDGGTLIFSPAGCRPLAAGPPPLSSLPARRRDARLELSFPLSAPSRAGWSSTPWRSVLPVISTKALICAPDSSAVTLSKTKKKPGLERKGKVVTDIKDAVEHYANAYVFTYDNMRNQKLKDLREQLKSSSRIFLAGKKVMQIALGRSPADEAKTGLHKLSKFLQGDTGLFFTNLPRDDVERLFREFEEHDFARTGSIATETVELKEGPLEQFTHEMEPFLRKQGLPVRLNKGAVELVADHIVCEEGKPISPEAAQTLRLLGMQMATFRLYLVCRWSSDDFETYKEGLAQLRAGWHIYAANMLHLLSNGVGGGAGVAEQGRQCLADALRHARRPSGLPGPRPLLRRCRPPQLGAHLRIHGALRHGRHHALWAHNMAFGRRLLPFVGRPAPALAQDYMLTQALLPSTLHLRSYGEVETAAVAPLYPSASMVFFQWAFAGVTVGLVAGAVLGRMSVKAWMAFVPLWTTLSYTHLGRRLLFHWGVMDYSGGYVVHLAAGVSGYTAAYWVGPRRKEEAGGGNLVVMVAGAGILWMGWTGFNGGDPFSANTDSSVAVLNTHICALTSILAWICCDVAVRGRPSVVGAVQGMITGLVCITPAAGLVQGWAALLMGVASETLPCYTMNAAMSLKVDDTLGILHTHAVSGVLGGVLTGVFATCSFRGLIYGVRAGGVQVLKQVAAALFVAAWNVVATSIILVVVRAFVPLRMTEEELLAGDIAIHGEQAYTNFSSGTNCSLSHETIEVGNS
uniref:Ribosome assembly factor mrt4 n=1 Tax=Oryza meridionalis TaxID=40149 RepID=A0A0E0F1I2_9ORYZ